MQRWVEAVRTGSFVTAERVRGYGLVLLLCELAILAFCVAGTHGWIVPLDQPSSSDFVSFYAAGLLADEGTPALAYDHAAHHAAEQAVTEPGIAYNFFFYPPVFLLLCAALARLPYLTAFLALQFSCLLPCFLLARRIVGGGTPTVLLAYPVVFWTFGTGQNAFLTAALLAGATLAVERRPLLAGALMGALCYKPHVALLLPAALVAGRHWRVLAAAAAAVATLVLASGLALGWETWRAFLRLGATAGSVYGTADTSINLSGMTSPYGLVLALGGDPMIAVAVQVAAASAAMTVVACVWARGEGLAIRAAVLLAAIPVAVPAVMFYDLMLTGLALAWLVRDGRDRGFPPWQRCGLALLFVLPFTSGNLGFSIQIGIPPLTAALGFGLALRQAFSGSGRRSLPERNRQSSSSTMPGSPLAIAR